MFRMDYWDYWSRWGQGARAGFVIKEAQEMGLCHLAQHAWW